jgi:hypothetical protein
LLIHMAQIFRIRLLPKSRAEGENRASFPKVEELGEST